MTEPRITVAEGDRRAACGPLGLSAEALDDGAMHRDWTDRIERVARAIARARTMAAFEERVRCVGLALEMPGGLDVASKLAGSDAYESPLADLQEDDDIPDDDIRALVLAGW